MRILLLGVVMLSGLFGCSGGSGKPAASFGFTVQHVFYIMPPVDRVILVGTVDSGQVRPGDSLVVHARSGPISVKVESIESIEKGEIQIATKGQQVGLRVAGMSKDQAATGDQVTVSGR